MPHVRFELKVSIFLSPNQGSFLGPKPITSTTFFFSPTHFLVVPFLIHSFLNEGYTQEWQKDGCDVPSDSGGIRSAYFPHKDKTERELQWAKMKLRGHFSYISYIVTQLAY